MFILKKLYPIFKKNAIISLVIIFQFIFVLNNVYAETKLLQNITRGEASGTIEEFAKQVGFNRGEDYSLVETIGAYVQYFLSFMGVLFLGLMIYGGYVWMKARGNDSEATKAKGIMMDSGIGLIIIFSAYVITSFIISSLAISPYQDYSPTF